MHPGRLETKPLFRVYWGRFGPCLGSTGVGLGPYEYQLLLNLLKDHTEVERNSN